MATVTTEPYYVLHLSPAEAQVLQSALTVIEAKGGDEHAFGVNEHLCDICEALFDMGIASDDRTTFTIIED